MWGVGWGTMGGKRKQTGTLPGAQSSNSADVRSEHRLRVPNLPSNDLYLFVLSPSLPLCRHFTAEAKDLIKRLLTQDKTRRLGCSVIGAKEIREHPWFAPVNWDTCFALGLLPPLVPKVKDVNDTSNFDAYPDSDGDTAAKLSAKDAELFAELDKF
jgi:hypothetical protein